MRVLVTGAGGFVGAALCRLLAERSREVAGAVRQAPSRPLAGVAYRLVRDQGGRTDWADVLAGAEAVVHCAGRQHVLRETAADPLAAYREVNVVGTARLARQAAAAGVRRFVFLSSVKVNGEGRPKPYSEADPPAPLDPYAVSKREAEAGLWEIAAETGLEVCVVRPPLVYGPGVKANFLSLMGAVRRGLPLPLAAVRARRSLVAIDNLGDFLDLCLQHPAAVRQTFLVSDGEDLSVPELIRRLAAAMGRPARLFPVPPAWLSAAAVILGKGALARRLCGELRLDIRKARELLGWHPVLSVTEGLRRAAAAYLHEATA